MVKNIQPAWAEEQEHPAAGLVRRLGKARMGFQDRLETSVYPSDTAILTAVEAEMTCGNKVIGDVKSSITWSLCRRKTSP